MLIYCLCKAFLHLDPYYSCASVCLHLSSGLAFIPKEEPDPLGSMHIYINTAYIGSLWRPKRENHLQIVNVSSEDGTRWVFLRTLLNIVVYVSWSIILLKKRQQLYPSDYSKFLSNPATCYIPLQRHQVAVRRPFLIKSFYNFFLILRW